MSVPMTEQCLVCGQQLYHDFQPNMLFEFKPLSFQTTCQTCQQQLITLVPNPLDCAGCGRTLLQQADVSQPFVSPYLQDKERFCYDCFRWLASYPREFIRHQAVYGYSAFFQRWLYQFKYQGDVRQATVPKENLNKMYKKYKHYTWLVLPSSPQSLAERGFHATATLLDYAGIPYICPFEYIGDGFKQAQKDRQTRLNLTQPFKFISDKISPNRSKLLIFDDLYTTGATLLKAKEAICMARKSECDDEIISLSLARDQLTTLSEG